MSRSITKCADCQYCADRMACAPNEKAKELFLTLWARDRYECRGRMPVTAVDRDGDVVPPYTTVYLDTGFCGEGLPKEVVSTAVGGAGEEGESTAAPSDSSLLRWHVSAQYAKLLWFLANPTRTETFRGLAQCPTCKLVVGLAVHYRSGLSWDNLYVHAVKEHGRVPPVGMLEAATTAYDAEVIAKASAGAGLVQGELYVPPFPIHAPGTPPRSNFAAAAAAYAAAKDKSPSSEDAQ